MAGKALYLIAAMERNQGIGFKNDLPWHLEREYAYFERMSTVTQQPNKMVNILAYFLVFTTSKLGQKL
jgi:dihydrofolate reductase